MDTITTLYLIISTNLLVYTYSSNFPISRTKRTDIDLSTCIDNFDIHRDKIIRTQDSQKMGAKYLNAIDLGSREECLRLCCETENCDVFVYEDKSSGSCYLFHCGPPEDFKCKFTHHVNYSSAVLAINRHIPDLESQIKLTKHEQDLTKLRKSDAESDSVPNVPEDVVHQQPVLSSTTVRTKEVLPDQKNKVEEKKCSRYQFECRSTRECIAIYNACDGIPQCADGSDEATELGCPEATTPPPPNQQRTIASNPVAATNYDKNVVNVKNQDSSPRIDVYHAPLPRSDTVPDNSIVRAANPDFLRPIPQDQRIPPRAPPYPEPPEYNPQMPEIGWNPHQSGPVPYQMPPAYPGKTSHIFNHKENGLQVPEAEIRYNRNKGAMNFFHRTFGIQNEISKQGSYPDGSYPKIQNYYGENYRQSMEIPTWVNAHQDDLRYTARLTPDTSYNNNRGMPPDKYIDQSKTTGWTDGRENPEHIQIKMAHELKHSKESHSTETHQDSPKIKIIEKPTEQKHDDYPDVVAYKMDGNDGVAQTPGGAVLSLTLGLIITCIMAVMIGCRLRILKRRVRKGAKGYAHDADYLVNGMYL